MVRTREYALWIGRELRLNEDKIELLKYAADLHDFGKIFTPYHVLSQVEGKLTTEQFEIMKLHTIRGYDALELSGLPPEITLTVLYHMERWDGTGYPEGLKGLDIPLFSRIVAIADVWDALTSDRPYRKAYKYDTALGIMNAMSSHFDPRLLYIFMRKLNE
jgi:putative two-component system response regulator